LYAELVAAYGGACAVCGTPPGALNVSCIAEDGGWSGQPQMRSAPFWAVLRDVGWPRRVRFDGRLHRVELRCAGCRRLRQVRRHT